MDNCSREVFENKVVIIMGASREVVKELALIFSDYKANL
jgi:hypothetical protein